MIATVYSALSGKLVGKHPTLGVLVREDGMVLKPRGWSKGCSLRKDGKYRYVLMDGKWKGVHRLVAQTFLPNPENKPTVDHINRDTTDNRLCNLRWANHSEQRDNSSQVLDAMDLGVRHKDDPAEWARRNARRLRDIKLQDPEWVEKERTRLKEYARLRRQDPEFLKKEAEKQRERRARKKAEQEARSS
jgi:HNH endonuclease.